MRNLTFEFMARKTIFGNSIIIYFPMTHFLFFLLAITPNRYTLLYCCFASSKAHTEGSHPTIKMGGSSNGRGSSHKVFGQSMKRRSKTASTRYQRQFGNYGNSSRGTNNDGNNAGSVNASLFAQMKRAKQLKGNALDREVANLEEFVGGASSSNAEQGTQSRRGWLYNVLPTTVTHSDERGSSAERAGE